MTEVTKKEFNGLGQRVRTVENQIGVHEARIGRNEIDIDKSLTKMDRLPLFIIGGVMLPSVLILYQILTK